MLIYTFRTRQILRSLALLLLFLSANISEAKGLNCQASFEQVAYTGTGISVNEISFHNFSTGEYEHLLWDFGDGNTSSSGEESITHTYTQSGTYVVSLLIWNDDGSCNSSISKQITVSIVNNDCQLTDCVWPGDANQDGKADALDLLHIGLGYGASGPPRSGDPEEWTGQVAQDWDWETTDGINYKHLDANGDGTINEFDLLPIIHHYSPMLYDAGFYSSNDGPVVYLDFNVDTIVINQNTGSNINITAGLIIGASSHPVENLHGLSLSLEYDASMTEVVNGVHTQYNPFSFFGNDESVMAFGNSLYNSKQLDFAMSRKADSGINGYGRVATFDFIIVVDIIDGRVESAVPFKLPIKSIRAYDAEGNIIKLNIEAKEAEVVFVKESSTSTQENGLQSKVRLFPNPAKDGSVNIEWKDLEVQSVICYNSLGQQIKATSVENADHLLYVTDDLATGVYLLQIQTDKGLVNKKLLVQ